MYTVLSKIRNGLPMVFHLLSVIAKFRFLNSCLSRICYPVTVLKTHYKKGLIWLWNWDFLIIFKHFALTLFLFWINLFSILWFLSSFVIKSYRSSKVAVLLLLRDNMHFLKAIITNAAAPKPHQEDAAKATLKMHYWYYIFFFCFWWQPPFICALWILN